MCTLRFRLPVNVLEDFSVPLKEPSQRKPAKELESYYVCPSSMVRSVHGIGFRRRFLSSGSRVFKNPLGLRATASDLSLS